MIESKYWKIDLLSHSHKLKEKNSVKRWSAKAQVKFEKEIIVSFFIIRKLIESHKISKATRDTKLQLLAFPRTSKEINNFNYWDIDEFFDLSRSVKVTKSIKFIANQLIHSLVIYAIRKNNKWDHILTCSDFEKSKRIYLILIKDVIKIFDLVGNDIHKGMAFTYDPDIDDYKIEVY